MSFIGSDTGNAYAPGWFLNTENCERKTRQINQAGATTAADGSKYVKMGTPYPANDATAIGFVFEDVDVTQGNMPGSVVLKGEVILDRLPVTLASAAQTALEGKGFTFVATAPAVTRPNWVNE